MKIFVDQIRQDRITKKYLFLDTGVLSHLVRNRDLFAEFVALFNNRQFIIDPFIKFEFLRDTFAPKAFDLRKAFIENAEFFLEAENHPSVHRKVQDNALIISQMLAQSKISGAPTVDLFLIGRIMLYADAALITCDFSDFPTLLFDRLNLITIDLEQKVQSVPVNVQVIELSMEKFASCSANLKKVTK